MMVTFELLAMLSGLIGFGRYVHVLAKTHDRPVMSIAGFVLALVSALATVGFIAAKIVTKGM